MSGRLRLSPARYHRLCVAALVALVAIVVTGAAVRLTGSGLGCTDWPACSDDRLVAPLEWHPMVEFVNRLITGVVSLAVIAAVAGAVARVPRRADLILLALGLVAGVVAQILLGAALVLADLDPRFTIGHFLLSAVLVADAVVLAHRAGVEPGVERDVVLAHRAAVDPGAEPGAHRAGVEPGADDVVLAHRAGSQQGVEPEAGPAGTPGLPRRARWLPFALLVAGAAVLVTGTVVTGAGPHGGDERAARLNLDVAAVARLHSVMVWTFLALLVALVLLLRQAGSEGDATAAERLAVGGRLLAVAVAQGAVGYLQYVLDVPPLLVGVHVLGATLVWAGTVKLALVVVSRAEPRLADGRRPVVRTRASRAERPVLSGR